MNRLSFRYLAAASALAFAATACSSSTTSIAPAGTATLPAGSSSTCINPRASAQTVTLPQTGGVTATLSIGAFAANTSDCIAVVVTTGSAVTASALRRDPTATTSSRPVLTISLSEAFPGASALNPLIVSGATLNTPSLTVFPDGTYYAQVTYGPGAVQTFSFTAKGGVLTLDNTGTAANPSVISVTPGSTAVLALFGPGVIPVVPTATPAPVVTPTPIPIASPSAAPTLTPSPTPVASPSPGQSATPSATATPAATATPSPSGQTFNLHEGPFTADCNCSYYGKMVASVDVVGAAGGDISVDEEFVDGTSIKAYYVGSNLRASAMMNFALQVQHANDEDVLFSSASDVDSSTCGNSQATTCTVPILFSVSSVQSQFENQFAAYRAAWNF